MIRPHTGSIKLPGLVLAGLLALLAGCQSLQVERKTVAMAGRLSDIQYKQVMDNLALLADKPNALPHFVLADSGKTIIQATGQTSMSLVWNLFTVAGKLFDNTLLGNANPGLGYIQQDQLEWDGTPALDPIQELVMRGLYCKALGFVLSPAELSATEAFFMTEPPPFNDVNVRNALSFMEKDLAGKTVPAGLIWSLANYKPAYVNALRETYERIGPSGVHIGHCLDVPKAACYVSRHGHTYVWVMPDDLENLTNLTIAVLDVASTDTASQAGKASKQASPRNVSAPAGLQALP
jgi:hypothetical protein